MPSPSKSVSPRVTSARLCSKTPAGKSASRRIRRCSSSTDRKVSRLSQPISKPPLPAGTAGTPSATKKGCRVHRQPYQKNRSGETHSSGGPPASPGPPGPPGPPSGIGNGIAPSGAAGASWIFKSSNSKISTLLGAISALRRSSP